jgi:hypothetical protein
MRSAPQFAGMVVGGVIASAISSLNCTARVFHWETFSNWRIDLGEGEILPVSTWPDLDYALGEQRGKILDTLRKYYRI